MPNQKYLVLQRSTPAGAAGPQQEAPSPAQMQAMYAAFNAWKEQFKDNIVDLGGRLKRGGKVLSSEGVSDGPFVEAKEIIGGFMVVVAESYEQALEVARGCPGLVGPGSSCEIRELAGP
jgi:hypothetical protein